MITQFQERNDRHVHRESLRRSGEVSQVLEDFVVAEVVCGLNHAGWRAVEEGAGNSRREESRNKRMEENIYMRKTLIYKNPGPLPVWKYTDIYKTGKHSMPKSVKSSTE